MYILLFFLKDNGFNQKSSFAIFSLYNFVYTHIRHILDFEKCLKREKYHRKIPIGACCNDICKAFWIRNYYVSPHSCFPDVSCLVA